MDDSLVPDLVQAVADRKGVEPTEIEQPLEEFIDLDAVQMLAENESASWKLWIELPEYSVTITSDGWILVDGQREVVWA